MPPKKTDGEGAVPSLTDSETKFVKALFDSMNQRPDVNFENVASLMGLANAKSARDRFRLISKKHGWTSMDGSGGGIAGGSPAKPKGALTAKNASKVTKAATPKKKGTAQKKPKAKQQESDDDEDVSAKLESDSDGKNAAQESSSDSEE